MAGILLLVFWGIALLFVIDVADGNDFLSFILGIPVSTEMLYIFYFT